MTDDQFLERLDRSLTLDEVRVGAPNLGWNLVRDQFHDVSEEDAKKHQGVQAGLYRVLAFESESGRVALVAFFDPDANGMRMMEFEHLLMKDVSLTIPDIDSTVPSSKVVEQILGRWAEGGVDLRDYQEGSQ
jgi:hypothetical protein